MPSRRATRIGIVGGLAAIGTGAVTAYAFVLRPRHLHRGATEDEAARVMPGDSFVAQPSYSTTRAVTVHATAEQIWPWLAQMGVGGAGFYTRWDRLLGVRARKPADEAPGGESQLKVGDLLASGPGGLEVLAVGAPRSLVLGSTRRGASGEILATWAIALYPRADGTTRLVTRIRARLGHSPRSLLWAAVLDPGAYLLEQRWLRGLKERAERAARSESAVAGSSAGER